MNTTRHDTSAEYYSALFIILRFCARRVSYSIVCVCVYTAGYFVSRQRQGEPYFTRSRRFLTNFLAAPTFSLANIPARRPVFMVAEKNFAFLRNCFLRLRETLDFLGRTPFPRQFAADVHKGRNKTRRWRPSRLCRRFSLNELSRTVSSFLRQFFLGILRLINI